MRRPLSRALPLLLLAACALAQPPEGPAGKPDAAPSPEKAASWQDAACDPKGRGVLLRARDDSGAQALAGAGLDAVGSGAPAAGSSAGAASGSSAGSAAKEKAPAVYRVEPGEGCADRLSRLRAGEEPGARGTDAAGPGSAADGIEITAAPAKLPTTAAALDAYFKGAGTLGALSRMSFKTPADLSKLFDKARALGRFEDAQKLALKGGGVFDAGGPGGPGGAGAGAVLAEAGPKPDPSGSAYQKPDQLNKVGAASAPPALVEPERDELEPPRVYSRYAPVRAVQRAYDWSAEAASNIADGARFTYDKLRGNAPVSQHGPITVVNGWAQLPKSGPGYVFVGRGQYGTPTLVAGLMDAAADPMVNIAGSKPMQIVAISKYGGGPFPPHKTHDKGIDVDVSLSGFRNGPLSAQALDRNLLFAVSVVEHMKPTYILLDSRRQFELQARALALLKQDSVDAAVKARIRAAYPLLFQGTPPPRRKRLFSHVVNHYDHFHIRERAGEIGR